MTDNNPENTNLREAILLGVLVVLILASGVQAYQLHDIKQSISDGTISTATQDAPTTTSSEAGGVPQNLQDLPQMVGGC